MKNLYGGWRAWVDNKTYTLYLTSDNSRISNGKIIINGRGYTFVELDDAIIVNGVIFCRDSAVIAENLPQTA